jgi:HAMP domain-containing protein
MNQSNNYKFSKEERYLFIDIADRIRANSEDYKEAGKWLDEYCSESAYWTRKEKELEKIKEKRDSFPVLLDQREVGHLENEIKGKRTPASIILFQEAQHYLLDNYKDQEFLSKEVAAKVIITTWLLTDPDAGKADLHITGFEKWKWEPLDDVLECNRDFKGFLFAQNKDRWMRLVNIAWEKIATSKKDSSLEAKSPELLQNILWILRYGKKWWWLLLLAAFVLLLLYVLPKLNLEYQDIPPKAETSIVSPNPNNYSRTPLYFRTKKRVDGFYENIRNEKLDPWLFINVEGVKNQVTKYNGDIIIASGAFTGSKRLIFWSDDFIPPFIEDAIIKVFDQTIDECRKSSLDPEIYVYEAKIILDGFIYKIYNHMADMDQKLLKQVHPENSGRRDVKSEIEKMCKYLDEQYNAALLLASKGKALGESKISLRDKLVNFLSAMELWQKVVAALIAASILALPAFLRRFFKRKLDSPVIPIPAASDTQSQKEQAQTPISEKEKAGVPNLNHDIDQGIKELEYRIEAVFADGRDLSEFDILRRLGIPSYNKTEIEQVQETIGRMITSGKLEPSRYGGGIHRIRKGQ